MSPSDEPDSDAGRARARKSPNAFRTISEVADDLQIPQHVLRFWESKFPQLKPLKRGGGRRYYRPEDIALLKRVSDLLYTQGYTIKGVQRLLREGGIEEAGVSPELPLGDLDTEDADGPDLVREALDALERISHELRALAARG
jgi:DNA-binding transcriptional MerR regulator